MTYPFSYFHGWTVDFWEWISHFIPHFMVTVITYPCSSHKQTQFRFLSHKITDAAVLVNDLSQVAILFTQGGHGATYLSHNHGCWWSGYARSQITDSRFTGLICQTSRIVSVNLIGYRGRCHYKAANSFQDSQQRHPIPRVSKLWFIFSFSRCRECNCIDAISCYIGSSYNDPWLYILV